MTDEQIRAALSDRGVVGLTLYGEARSEPAIGRTAVASVIRNRLLSGRWGKSYRAVCLAPAQFSCWKPVGGPANYRVVMATARALVEESPTLPASLRACLEIADKAIAGTLPDPTHGALYYLTGMLYRTAPPSWALKCEMTAEIGRHVFLK